MSRQLKFRAWDTVAQKFLIPWPDGFHLFGETTCFDLIGQQLKERSPEQDTLAMLNDVVITQFTGLKDKHGVEIYEGDIVSNLNGVHMSGREVVEFENGGFSPFSIAGWEGSADWDTCEVIGNIHENPDLL